MCEESAYEEASEVDGEEFIVCETCEGTSFLINTDGDAICAFCGEIHELVDDVEEEEIDEAEEED